MQGSGETRTSRRDNPKPDDSQQTQTKKPRVRQYPRLYLGLSVVILLGTGLGMIYILVVAGENIWDWGTQTWYHTIAFAVVIGLILLLSLGVLMLASENVSKAIRAFLETPLEKDVKEQKESIKDAEERILKDMDERIGELDAKVEEDKKEIQELRDLRGVFQLCMFRRKQLSLYYTLNHGQTKASFRCSLVAMFAGFFIIAIGIASSFGFFEVIFPETTPTDMDNVVIAGGVLAELISALFLWIYLASAKQLMFFYRNQAFAHSVMTSLQIADSMTDVPAKNAAKQEIIKNYLGYSFLEPSIELPKSGKKQAAQ